MVVAFADEAESKEEDTKGEDGELDMSGEQTSWLLRQVVAMSKKQRSGSGSSEDNDDNNDNDDNDDDDDDNEEDHDSEKEKAG